MALPEDAPCPRLCHLIKWPDFDGYGFNLHAEKNKSGQFIGKVDDDSPAVLAGLREGDKIIEVLWLLLIFTWSFSLCAFLSGQLCKY